MNDDVRLLKNLIYAAGDGRHEAALERIAARLETTEAALDAARPFAQYANNREGGMGVLLTDIQAKFRAALAAFDKAGAAAAEDSHEGQRAARRATGR